MGYTGSGCVCSSDFFVGGSIINEKDYSGSIVPVVTLQSNIGIEWDENDNAWNFVQ